ncbi:MAG: hypothetical protein Q9N34_09525 [Aquificota bacterium]|nr:hypothetical protein [Aquificota bacterium]
MKNNKLDLTLLEEMTQLEYFLVKKPMTSPDFWGEWQEKYGKASTSKRSRPSEKIANTKRKLSHTRIQRVERTLMSMYDDVPEVS